MNGKKFDIRYYLAQEPVILALLTLFAVIGFVAVSGLSHVYHSQRESLGDRWFVRGVADLANQSFARAVTEFRTALLYSRDDYQYQLKLAEALLGQHRTDEAHAYLVNLWERQPENGTVNLELARIAVEKDDKDHALRYYHNAIYAVWPGNQEVERQQTRFELIEYLLKSGSKVEAQSELIALNATLGEDPSAQARVGDLFVQAGDYQDALAAYTKSLKANGHTPAALAGAGEAAFDLGRYSLAEQYFRAAVALQPKDAQSAARLKTSELVLQMDPFRRHITASERSRIVMAAYGTAGRRLQSCLAATSTPNSLQGLSADWTKMKSQITARGLRRDPDLVETAMNLVFEIERETSSVCGVPTGTDEALLLISKLHERS